MATYIYKRFWLGKKKRKLLEEGRIIGRKVFFQSFECRFTQVFFHYITQIGTFSKVCFRYVIGVVFKVDSHKFNKIGDLWLDKLSS